MKVNNLLIMKKIKINLEYKTQHIVIEIEPYKTLKNLKEKASKLFFPLSNDFKILMNNKDQSAYEDYQIGEIYKNKPNLNLKLIDTDEYLQVKTEESFKIQDYINPETDRKTNSLSEREKKEKLNNEKQLMDKVERKTNYEKDKLDESEGFKDSEFMCKCNSSLLITYFCRKCKDFICKACRINVNSIINYRTLTKLIIVSRPIYITLKKVQIHIVSCF